jgi:predicted TIM-barrel fold metal-dependent hydrolase
VNVDDVPVDDEVWLISVDDHVVEPPDVWQARVPAKLKDDAPRVVPLETGGCAWLFEGATHPIHGMLAVVNKPPSEWTASPVTFDDFPAGAYDPVARELDLLADGVLASMPFPSNFPRFSGQLFSLTKDRDLGFACIQAYNDWLIDEWCGSVPGRYIPLVIIPFWDPQLAAREIARCVDKGARAVAFSENPSYLGFPSIHDHDHYWDPVFTAVCDAGVPLCAHLGSSSRMTTTAPDAPPVLTPTLPVVNSMSCLADWMFSGNLQRFEPLKVCLSEGGIGWIPLYLERVERVVTHQAQVMLKVEASGLSINDVLAGKVAQDADISEDLLRRTLIDPYELFRDHIYGCFIDEPLGLQMLQHLPIDNIMIETDYPHPDCSFPHSRENATQALAHLDDESRWKVLRGNAQRVFDFEPAPPSPAALSAARARVPVAS